MIGLSSTAWYVIAALLGAGLLAAAVWFLRRASLRRAPLPVAFLLALVIHALLAGSLFFVGLGEQIVEAVQKVHTYLPPIADYAASTRFEAHEGYRSAPQPFELVKELGAKDSVASAQIEQQPLETPEMRVSATTYKTEIPVPREETAGPRADETPEVPITPTPASPARTVIPEIETPAAPIAPIDEVPGGGGVPTPETRVASANVEAARAPSLIDPAARAGLSRSTIPAGRGESLIPADLGRDGRSTSPPAPPVRPTGVPTLARSTRPALEVESAKVEPIRASGGTPSGVAVSSNTNKAAVAVNVGRQATEAPLPRSGSAGPSPAGTSVGVKGAATGPAIGPPAERADPLPKFAGTGDLPKRRSTDAALPYAEATVGPESLLRLRQGENKSDGIERRGGSKASQEAVSRGLTWLERHQFPDGRWSLHEFSQQCKNHAACTAEGNLPCDTAATAFALLPFLGEGHTQHEGKYPEAVQRGLDWLVAKQKKNGELTTGDEGKARLYGHGIATIALCEAYAMSEDPKLREPAQRAIDFIVASQHKASGGWRYQPNEPGDTSVVGWQVMALKSGQMARLNVPQQSFDLTRKWLDSVEGRGSQRGRFGYQSRIPTPSMTAEGLLCRQYLGVSRDDPSLISGANYLLANLPDKDQANGYYWYYGTQTMYHLQGEHWKRWNAALRDMLVEAQIKEGPMAGTWDPVDRGEVTGGRVFSTSLRVLMLEVYYRHLPLYQALEE